MDKYFKEKEVYMLPSMLDSIFLCESCSGGYIGKIVKYDKVSTNIFERTNIQYFLNTYVPGDFKSFVLNRENYEIVGNIDINYKLSSDKTTLIKE